MTHYPSAYITLDELIRQYILTDEAAFSTTTTAAAAITGDYANVVGQLKDFIDEVSEGLYLDKQRDFLPYVDTLTIYAQDKAWRQGWTSRTNTYEFWLDHLHNRDLLSVDSITLNGTTINSSYYRLDTSGGYPADKIIFDRDNVTFPASYDFSTSLVIVGTWGYHEDPDNMWADSGDTVQDNPLSSSATTLNVTSGANFEVYQYIKIEDEYLFITAISTNALTVRRGVNGTSAAAHIQTSAISTYAQMPSVAKEVTRMVIRAYAMKNGVNLVTAGDTITDITHGEFKLSIPRRWSIRSV